MDEKNNDFLNKKALEHFNIHYLFPYQRLVITNILEAAGIDGFKREPERNPVTGEWEMYDTRPVQIVILPTGSGKSLCYMLPAALLPGATLVIFPLLSLITDQARRLLKAGFHPAVLKGGQHSTEREEIWRTIKKGKTKIILSNPETILRPEILSRIKTAKISHLVIDEMHIVSEWGDTFRPSYLKIKEVYKAVDIAVITAFTATASPVILSRVKEILFPGLSPAIISADPDRPNIRYRVIRSLSKNHDLAALIHRAERPVLVFNRSRTGAELTARYLGKVLNGNDIYFYHAGLSSEEKKKIESWFLHSKRGILTATCAYGLGVDKSNIRTVIHLDPPPSVEAYLQESGRAGRDRKEADAILLVSEKDFLSGYAIKNTILKERYLNFLHAVTDDTHCRRQSLLKLLGADNDSCSGCDVCSRTVITSMSGIDEITGYVKSRNRKSSVREALLTLGGKQYPEVYAEQYYRSPYYKALAEWTLPEIKEALIALKTMGCIAIPGRGPYRRKLVYKHPPKANYPFSTFRKHPAHSSGKD